MHPAQALLKPAPNSFKLLFLLIFLGISPAFATDVPDLESIIRTAIEPRCNPILLKPRVGAPVTLEQGKTYFVMIEDQNLVRTLTFMGPATGPDEKGRLKFVQAKTRDRGQVEYKIPGSAIVGATPARRERTRTLLKRAFTSQLAFAQKAVAFMYLPYKLLDRSNPGIKVVGTLQSSKKTGKKISDHIYHFDTEITAMGFQAPPVRVVVSENALIPDLIGPFQISSGIVNTWNTWSGDANQSLISAGKNDVALNPFVLAHERMHSVLHTTYNPNAYVNSDQAVQEAFADFASAHVHDLPRFTVNLRGHTASRDISTRQAKIDDTLIQINNPLDFRPGRYHHNSLLFSNFLWELRARIGREEMSRLFELYVYSLNLYRPSFENRVAREISASPRTVMSYSKDLEYFMAVLTRVLKDSGGLLRRDSRQKALDWLSVYAYGQGYSITSIHGIGERLTETEGFDFTTPDLNHNEKVSAYTHLLGATTALIETGVVAWILESIL